MIKAVKVLQLIGFCTIFATHFALGRPPSVLVERFSGGLQSVLVRARRFAKLSMTTVYTFGN